MRNTNNLTSNDGYTEYQYILSGVDKHSKKKTPIVILKGLENYKWTQLHHIPP